MHRALQLFLTLQVVLLATLAAAQVTDSGLVSGTIGPKYLLQTPFIYISLNQKLGTFGDANTFPGISFDGSGGRTFPTNADFIVPGAPRESFVVQGTASGVGFSHVNDNANGYGTPSSTLVSMVDHSTTSQIDVVWTGTNPYYTITHEYQNDGTKTYVKVTTTITAKVPITGLQFARTCDPDQDSPVGTSRTANTCGWTNGVLSISRSDIVIAQGPIRPQLIICMYTNSAVPHSAGISPGWSNTPSAYETCADSNGDYAIGLVFQMGNFAAGASKSVVYYYGLASRTEDFATLLGETSQCLAGSYNTAPAGSAPVCAACPGGTFSTTVNAASCTPCAAGTYAVGGASSCTACPAGTTSGAGASACTAIPACYVASDCPAPAGPCSTVSCVSGSCVAGIAPPTTVCRPVSGACDVAEYCTGSSTSCPPDSFSYSTVVCRASAGPCDVAEQCTGSSAACPADSFKPSSTLCRASAGVCDPAEYCTGSGADCPVDALEPSTTVCRPPHDVCDVPDTCTGMSPSCPCDAFQPSTFVCRPAAGACDVPELCSGTGVTCPPDNLLPAGATCRPSAGDCDVEEQCTGSDASCPADSFLPPTTTCRPAADVCDVAEQCSGSDAACPGDAFQPSTTVCRASAGDCDVSESCTGSDVACPADSFKPSTTVCRASAGDCDVSESCTGSDASCPADTFKPSTTVCRASAGDCDVSESCTGSDASCPTDTFKPSTTVCRASAGVCDVSESCTGSAAACPADSFKPSTFACSSCPASLPAETCTGSGAGCPACPHTVVQYLLRTVPQPSDRKYGQLVDQLESAAFSTCRAWAKSRVDPVVQQVATVSGAVRMEFNVFTNPVLDAAHQAKLAARIPASNLVGSRVKVCVVCVGATCPPMTTPFSGDCLNMSHDHDHDHDDDDD